VTNRLQMKCWRHKWDIKKREKPLFFKWLDQFGIGWFFVLGAFLSLSIILPILFALDIGVFAIFIAGMAVLPLTGLLALGTDALESITNLEDKICLKCHLVVLNASKNATKFAEFEKQQKEAEVQREAKKEAAQKAADKVFAQEKAVKEAANKVFENRKSMWKIATETHEDG